MKHISDLFARHKKNLKPPQGVVLKEFVTVVKQVLGFDIKTEQCSYVVSTKTVHLNTPSVLKSEILRQKERIIKELKKQLGNNAPQQIL